MWLTPQDVAARFQLSYCAVTRALREGRLPGVKILGSWRVDPAELEDWIDSQRPIPKPSRQSDRDGFLAEVHQIRSEHATGQRV